MMTVRTVSGLLRTGLVALAVGHGASVACAQSPRRGEIEFRAVASGEERTTQSNLYVMDVMYKPMRMIAVDITDPQTGQKRKEYVWYIVYRAFNRKLDQPDSQSTPVNELDRETFSSSLFVPEFTLMTTDTDEPKFYRDEVIPEALAAINKREQGQYRSGVDIVGPIPAAGDAGDPKREGLAGIAMWRGIDPDADRYTVYLSGFSNGIRIADGADGKPMVQAKTIMQQYWRPGDRFDQSEPEVRQEGVSQWIYR